MTHGNLCNRRRFSQLRKRTEITDKVQMELWSSMRHAQDKTKWHEWGNFKTMSDSNRHRAQGLWRTNLHVSQLLWTKCELLHQVLLTPSVDQTGWMQHHVLNYCDLSWPSNMQHIKVYHRWLRKCNLQARNVVMWLTVTSISSMLLQCLQLCTTVYHNHTQFSQSNKFYCDSNFPTKHWTLQQC